MNYQDFTKEELIHEINSLNAMVKELEQSDKMRSSTMTALKESNNRFSSLIEEAPDAIILVDPNTGMILYANPIAAELLNGKHKEIVGRNQEELFPENNDESLLNDLERSEAQMPRKYPRRFETRIKCCNSREIPVEATAKTLLIDGDLLLMCILRDMTSHKNLENELRKAKEVAESSDRLKSEFLSQISHEVRTPINTIVNFTNIYREDILSKFDNEAASEINFGLTVINRAADRLIRTLDLMVNISEVASGSYLYRPEMLDLMKDIILPQTEFYRKISGEKEINFKVDQYKERFVVSVDKFSVGQIIENIYSNAIRFTEKGEIKTSILKEKDKFILVISDTGIGISAEYLPHIYEPFSQEEQGYTRSFEGNGLGLSLVKKYCELNNLDIEIKSKKNKGTDVIIIFRKL